jgi:hypothetical protein
LRRPWPDLIVALNSTELLALRRVVDRPQIHFDLTFGIRLFLVLVQIVRHDDALRLALLDRLLVEAFWLLAFMEADETASRVGFVIFDGYLFSNGSGLGNIL